MKAMFRFIGAVACALIMGTGCRTLVRPKQGSPEFSGRMLIGVTRDQGERIARSRFAGPMRAAGTEWRFSPVPNLSKPDARSPGTELSWVIASPPREAATGQKGKNPWDRAHDVLDGRTDGVFKSLMAELNRAAGSDTSAAIVEPDFFVSQERQSKSLARAKQEHSYRPGGSPLEVQVCDKPSAHWPRGRTIDWYMTDDYSQLRTARKYVRAKAAMSRADRRIKIALIDTGYNAVHASAPAGLNKQESFDFTRDPMRPQPGAEDPFKKGLMNYPGHGTACLGMLAGNHIKSTKYEFDDYLGGAPDFEVVVYRISDSVIHFFPSIMAAAIKCAVAEGCDVISLSHGGLPSKMLTQAVNEAYENGTAIFAASGDFIEVPFLGYTSTQTIVYPAAYDRVVAVCGATAAKRSYGRSPGLFSLILHRNLGSWMVRGNYGPDAYMHEAIAGYSPNVMWAKYCSKYPANLIDLDGSGTSAATPQVAAAAALWLSFHKDDPVLKEKWRSWEKVEAVYLALFDSAEKNTPEGGDSYSHFGNGLLKAHDALKLGPPKFMDKRPVARVEFGWVRVLAGLLPAVRSASTADSAASSAHVEMVQTEIAQLVHGSAELQEVVERLDLYARGSKAPEPEKLRVFFKAIRQDKNASRYLKSVLQKAEEGL